MISMTLSGACPRRATWFLCGIGLAAIQPAYARSTSHRHHGPVHKVAPTARPASRSASHSVIRPDPVAETMTVHTRSLSHSVDEHVIARSVLNRIVPGASPLQALAATTPGVAFGSDDPFGMDSLANTTYVRGFNQSQLAFALDGIPLGDQYFFSGNGLDVNQAVSQEDIETVGVSQGAGALDVPGSENLGGAIRFTTSDPSLKRSGRISQTFGSNSNFRTFGRMDSGTLNSSGTRFFVSYARAYNRLWKGAGTQTEQQANMKLVQPVGRHATLTGFFGWSNYNQYNYLNMSLGIINHLGSTWTYLTPNYAEAYNAANGIYTPAVAALGNPAEQSAATYYDAATIQRNYLSYVAFEDDLTQYLHSTTRLYAHVSSGDSEATATIPSPSGASLSQAVQMMGNRRVGGLQNFRYTIAHHTLSSGFWFENQSSEMPERLFSQPFPGEGTPRAATGPFVDPFATIWASSYSTNLFQFFLQDDWRLLPGLHLLAGFRSLTQTTHGGTALNDPLYSGQSALPLGSLTASAAFLPHVSLTWKPASGHEFYIDIAENMKTYPYSIWGSSPSGPWGDSSLAAFRQGQENLRPERTWTYVGGYRYTSDLMSLTADFYHTDYSNRALTVTTGPVYQLVNSYGIVGSETVNGADAGLTVHPIEHVSIYNVFSFADARYHGTMQYGGQLFDLSGSHQVAYPKFMYKSGINLAFGHFTADFNVSYTSRRPLSYTNDTYVPAYWLSSAGASYLIGSAGALHNMKVSLNVSNLFNSVYIGGMGVAGYPVTGDLPTLFIGAPRQFFGTIAAAF